MNQYYLVKLSIEVLVLVLKYPGGCKISVVIASEIQRLKETKNNLINSKQQYNCKNRPEFRQHQLDRISKSCRH